MNGPGWPVWPMRAAHISPVVNMYCVWRYVIVLPYGCSMLLIHLVSKHAGLGHLSHIALFTGLLAIWASTRWTLLYSLHLIEWFLRVLRKRHLRTSSLQHRGLSNPWDVTTISVGFETQLLYWPKLLVFANYLESCSRFMRHGIYADGVSFLSLQKTNSDITVYYNSTTNYQWRKSSQSMSLV